MSDNDNEFQDSQELDNEPEVTEQSDEQGEDNTDGDSLEAKNKQLYARLKKTEEELKALKEGDKQPTKKKSSKPASNEGTDDKVERLELKMDGYSREEVDFIQQYGGKQALENPIVKKALDNLKEERSAEQAQVTSSGAKSEFERKYSTDDLRKMSVEELNKILPKAE